MLRELCNCVRREGEVNFEGSMARRVDQHGVSRQHQLVPRQPLACGPGLTSRSGVCKGIPEELLVAQLHGGELGIDPAGRGQRAAFRGSRQLPCSNVPHHLALQFHNQAVAQGSGDPHLSSKQLILHILSCTSAQVVLARAQPVRQHIQHSPSTLLLELCHQICTANDQLASIALPVNAVIHKVTDSLRGSYRGVCRVSGSRGHTLFQHSNTLGHCLHSSILRRKSALKPGQLLLKLGVAVSIRSLHALQVRKQLT